MVKSRKITAQIKPNSKHRQEVVKQDDGGLIVFTKEPAIDGRANKSASELLAKHFKVPKSHIKLIRGQTTKHKVFEIIDVQRRL